MKLFFLPLLILLFLAAPAFARAGGGCFLPGTQVQTPEGSISIENLSAGDMVSSFTPAGKLVSSEVKTLFVVQRGGFYRIETESTSVNVTAEHPFLTSFGYYIEAKDISAGKTIMVLKSGKLSQERVLSSEFMPNPTVAYNLEVSNPNTFFANSLAVHNKGCFLPGTEVSTPSGPKRIETL